MHLIAFGRKRFKLTIMVSEKPINISDYDSEPPDHYVPDGPRNYIADGPIYDRKTVEALLVSGEDNAKLITKNAQREAQNFEWDIPFILELIKGALSDGQYLKSEWCMTGKQGSWAACDAYKLTRSEPIANSYSEMDFIYYIKFAINKAGKLLLIVSCHMSG